jgi:hypothetical protein
MLKQAQTSNKEAYDYARSLLLDRQRQLQSLELKHRQRLIGKGDYLSCQRSLLQAIGLLESLLRGADEHELMGGNEGGHESRSDKPADNPAPVRTEPDP